MKIRKAMNLLHQTAKARWVDVLVRAKINYKVDVAAVTLTIRKIKTVRATSAPDAMKS